MKQNKSYVLSCFVVQMIVIPVVFSLLFLLMNKPLNQFMKLPEKSSLGIDAMNLIYFIAAFLFAFIISMIIGMSFSKYSKTKPEKGKALYMPLIIPLIYALIFMTIAVIFSKGNYNSIYWGIYSIKNPFFIVFNFIIALSGFTWLMPVFEISGYIGFSTGVMLIKGQTKVNYSKVFKAFFIVLTISFISLSCINSKEIIQNGIIELRYGKSTVGNELTEFDLLKIAPFKENNGLAKLDKEASLKFTSLDSMPKLDGATAVYPVYAAFAQAVYSGLSDYYSINKNIDKDIDNAFVSSQSYPLNIISCTKTAKAYERLINGEVDMIFTAEPSESQIKMIKAKNDEFVLTQIGSEAFVFFTNITNPVDDLTIEQIQNIYSGKIKNWSEVGGPNRTIFPYQRPEDSGSQTIMQNRVMKGIKMLEPTKQTYAGGMGEIISQVASYKNAKNAIGYSFLYYSSSMIKNKQIKYISINGIKPSIDTVRSKLYPFTVPVYAVTLKSNSNHNATKFLNWILSDEGQTIVKKTGYVPVK